MVRLVRMQADEHEPSPGPEVPEEIEHEADIPILEIELGSRSSFSPSGRAWSASCSSSWETVACLGVALALPCAGP